MSLLQSKNKPGREAAGRPKNQETTSIPERVSDPLTFFVTHQGLKIRSDRLVVDRDLYNKFVQSS